MNTHKMKNVYDVPWFVQLEVSEISGQNSNLPSCESSDCFYHCTCKWLVSWCSLSVILIPVEIIETNKKVCNGMSHYNELQHAFETLIDEGSPSCFCITRIRQLFRKKLLKYTNHSKVFFFRLLLSNCLNWKFTAMITLHFQSLFCREQVILSKLHVILQEGGCTPPALSS